MPDMKVSLSFTLAQADVDRLALDHRVLKPGRALVMEWLTAMIEERVAELWKPRRSTRRSDLAAEVERLKKALRIYGDHRPECRIIHAQAIGAVFADDDCDCGYKNALDGVNRA